MTPLYEDDEETEGGLTGSSFDATPSPEVTAEANARDLATRRISIREYGAGELRAYLVRKKVPSDVAEKVVSDLVASGLVDDRRYARVIARHQAFRDKGPSYIQAKLRQKGVRLSLREVQALYEESLPGSVESEVEMARQVLERRYPHAREDQAEARRAYQALLRRGFSRDVVHKCLFQSRNEDLE